MAKKKAKPAARKTKAPAKKKAKAAKPAKKQVKKAAKPVKGVKPAKAAKGAKVPAKAAIKVAVKPGKGGKALPLVSAPLVSAPPRRPDGWMGPLPDKPLPRATKLPSEVTALTKREMEQVLTVGARGVQGEGSLKGRLIVYQGFPYLEVIGRDKRELWFLLQGPDQEVLPAYLDHKVSVSGLIRRIHNYGGTVDVRKYSAKKPEAEVAPVEEPEPEVSKLRLLSPGEVVTIGNPGMGVGVRGYATLRGTLEMSGEEFYVVVSNPGTRQQVAFTLEGKASKGLKKFIGNTLVCTGVVDKSTGWGGTLTAEKCEPRASEYPPVSRDSMDVVEVEGTPGMNGKTIDVKLNHGLSVKLVERQGWQWAVEPTTAKRVSLREVALNNKGGAVREFFFTPRNPGVHEVDFFQGKLHNPMNVSRQFKLLVNVKSPEVV